jgi:hypothetical protein
MSGFHQRSLADDHGIRATLFSVNRKQRRRSRVLVPVVLGVLGALLVIGLLVGRAWLLPRYNDKFGDPPLLGHLEVERKVTAVQLTVGQFVVAFNPELGGQVFITHKDEPQRRIWESVPGMSFVAAAYGQEKVEESRGSFFFADKATGSSCATQRLEQIREVAGSVQIKGTLRCTGAGSAPYLLKFFPIGPHQLGFDLTIDDDDRCCPGGC